MNPKLIKFIELCLVDGVISDKEREVIFRKSQEFGVPEDECEIILEGMIQKLGKKDSLNQKSDSTESVNETKLDKSSKENKVDFTDFINNYQDLKGVLGQNFIMDLEKTLKSINKWTIEKKVKESIKQLEDKIKFRFRNSFVVGEDFLVSMESGHRISLNQINDLEIKDGGVFSTRGLFLGGEHFGEFFDMNDVEGKELFLKFKDFINQSLHPKEENNDTEINHEKENKLGSINQLNSVEVTKDNSEKNEGVSTETTYNDPLISEDRIGVKTDVKVKVKGESNLTPKKKKVSNNKSKGSKLKGEESNIEPEYLSKIYDSIYSFSGEFSSNFVKKYYKKNRSNPLLLDKTEIIRLSNKVFGCGPFDHYSTKFSEIENSRIEFGIYRNKTGVVFYPDHISFLRSEPDGHQYISLDLNSLFEMGFPNESSKTNRQIIELWMRSDGPTTFYQDRFSIKILKWYTFSNFNKWENGEGYQPCMI